jgi:hypothetical protein
VTFHVSDDASAEEGSREADRTVVFPMLTVELPLIFMPVTAADEAGSELPPLPLPDDGAEDDAEKEQEMPIAEKRSAEAIME